MNELSLDSIKSKIYIVRERQVILDSDLARYYRIETKVLVQNVKRNLKRFPDNFMFQLTDEEFLLLRSQIVTSNNRGGRRYNPYAFTEHGVAMLSGLLNSPNAIEINIKIIESFVSMRHYLNENKDIYQSLNRLSNKVDEHDEKLELLFSSFNKKERLFLPNEEYDSYSYVFNILRNAKKELIIIDSYADISLLDIVRNIDSSITLITSSKSKLSKSEIDKFNKQYNKLKVIKDNSFHDRYFIIDRKTIYHLGTSINYMGQKVFSINLLEDNLIKNELINYINIIL